MDVTDTKPLDKCCSKCGEIKMKDKFIPNRNICKSCRNAKCRENYNKTIVLQEELQSCNNCGIEKSKSSIIKNRNMCNECNNEKRRLKYKENEEHRKKLIQQASEYKHNKVIIRQQLKVEEHEKIGLDNKVCSNCNGIKSKENFRYNRLKCKDCERDEPLEKFKRVVRSRIHSALNKTKKTIEYLGCNSTDYLKWLLNNNCNYTLENRGKEWHIDHVIPLSKFNLDDEGEQLIAFNWRNTMPLSVKENLSKNNKIIKQQIEQHYKKLIEYHKENELDLPQVYNDLFAKHLDDGEILKPSLPLTYGNISEDLG